MTKAINLYDAIGGQPVVAAVVEEFYQRMLADPGLAPFFSGVPLSRLIAHQNAFLAKLLKGKPTTSEPLRAAHRDRGITDRHFDRVAQHMIETFRSLGASETLIGQVSERIWALREDITDEIAAAARQG